MSRLLGFLIKQFLPVGLVAVVLLGLIFPAPGRYFASLSTQYLAVGIIFLCSGLMLKTEEIYAAISAWRATLWGSLSILFITPVLGALLAFQTPLAPSFQIGLALFFCMPTTLSSGIALTHQARGNVALAVLLTTLTNLVGIFTVPFLLAYLMKSIGQVELSGSDLLVKLFFSILLPLAGGKYLRSFVEEWATRNRPRLTFLSSLALLSIPWMKISESSESLEQVAFPSLLALVVSGLVIHAVYLVLNDGVCRLLQFSGAVRKAVVILASQKTLPVAMAILAFLPESAVSPETKGLLAIPCITSHLGQIFMDAVIATRWGREAN